jgi:Tfp pilus assembly protein PilV
VIVNTPHSRAPRCQLAFSLVEVVIALGVIAVGVVTILGLFPTALQTGHSAQDETRAPQIAQSILTSITSQAQSALSSPPPSPAPSPAAVIYQPQPSPSPGFSYPVNLTTSSNPSSPNFYVDNDGKFTQDATTAAYAIFIFTNNSPPGFPTPPPAYANQVTVRVAWPANAPAANQTYRDYVRIISKY